VLVPDLRGKVNSLQGANRRTGRAQTKGLS
jgi:hypothetical protein